MAPGIYAESVSIANGKSLRATGTAASTIITSPTSPTVNVTGAAGTIQGFTIRGLGSTSFTVPGPPIGVLQLGADATIKGNVFDTDEDTAFNPTDVLITAGAPTVTQNSFSDIDLTPPDTSISAGPAAASTSNGSPSFTFASETGATFERSLDLGAFASCPAQDDLSGLSDGNHTLIVRAVDAVGNAVRDRRRSLRPLRLT